MLLTICLGIEKRYEIRFLEIGMEDDHVHFLVQSVPTYSPSKIVQMVKSITARKIFLLCPEVKEQLWGGELWTAGYFVNTVSKNGNENVIANYVRNQGKKDIKYKELYKQRVGCVNYFVILFSFIFLSMSVIDKPSYIALYSEYFL